MTNSVYSGSIAQLVAVQVVTEEERVCVARLQGVAGPPGKGLRTKRRQKRLQVRLASAPVSGLTDAREELLNTGRALVRIRRARVAAFSTLLGGVPDIATDVQSDRADAWRDQVLLRVRQLLGTSATSLALRAMHLPRAPM